MEGMNDLTGAPSRRALVVDDEVPLTEVVGSYLEREGFEVHAAHDGPTALSLAGSVDQRHRARRIQRKMTLW